MDGENDSLSLDKSLCYITYDTLYDHWLKQYIIHRKAGDFRLQRISLEKISKTLAFPNKKPQQARWRTLSYHMNMGVYYKEIGDLKNATIQQTIVQKNSPDPLQEDHDVFLNHNYSLQQLSVISSLKSNYNRAIMYMDYSLRLEKEKAEIDDRKEHIASMLAKKANFLEESSDHMEASKLYNYSTDKFISTFNSETEEHRSKYNYHYINYYRRELAFALHQENFDRARFLLKNIHKIQTTNDPRNNETYILKAEYFALQNIQDSARIYYKKAQEGIFKIVANYDQKLKYYVSYAENGPLLNGQEVLNSLKKAETIIDSIQQISEKWTSDMISVRKHKIRTLRLLDMNEKALDNISEFIYEIEGKLMKSIIFEDHLNFVQEFYPILEEGLEIIFEKGTENRALAFRIMECTKALSLYKESTVARQEVSLKNDSLISRYKYLSAIKSHYQLEISKGDDSNQYHNELYKTNEELTNLTSILRTTEQKKPLNLELYLKSLQAEESHILCFSGQEHYYFQLLSTNKVSLSRIPKQNLDSNIQNFTNDLVNYQSRDYIKSGKVLFQQIKGLLTLPVKTVIFSGDGHFGQLPLESLINEESSFILDKFSFVYTPSANVHYLLKGKKVDSNPTAAIFLPKEKSGELPLDYAKRECEQVQNITGATTFLMESAMKDVFMKESENYDILHLATHAEGVENAPSLSQIRFSDKNLGFDEIKSLVLKAEMVCLSACETNIGQNFKGEGVQSLARNFIASGANSVVSSMWKIPDQTTSEITISFYKYLKNGKSKSKALKLAKQDFLKAHPHEGSHPYYWAGLVLTGSDQALYPDYSWIVWVGSLVAMLLLALLLFYKFRNP